MTGMSLVYCPVCVEAIATGDTATGLPADHKVGEDVHPCSVIGVSPSDLRDSGSETGGVYFTRIDGSYSHLYV